MQQHLGEPPPHLQHHPGFRPQSYRPLRQAWPGQGWPRSRREAFEEYEEQNSCAVLSKYAIYGINIIFLLVGMSTLSLGAWLRVDSRFRDFLSERYRQAVDEAFWQAPTLYTFSYILITLGALMCIVAVLGCCGAVADARACQVFYGFAVFALLVATVSCIVYVLFKQAAIDVELSDALNYMVQHYYQGPGIVQESLDRLQQAFRCCGNAGCSDFRAFRQDPPRTCDIRCDGCHYRIWLALRIGFSVAIVVYLILILAQMVAIGVTVTMVFRKRRQKWVYDPRYLGPPSRPYSLPPPQKPVLKSAPRKPASIPRPVPKLKLR